MHLHSCNISHDHEYSLSEAGTPIATVSLLAFEMEAILAALNTYHPPNPAKHIHTGLAISVIEGALHEAKKLLDNEPGLH